MTRGPTLIRRRSPFGRTGVLPNALWAQPSRARSRRETPLSYWRAVGGEGSARLRLRLDPSSDRLRRPPYPRGRRERRRPRLHWDGDSRMRIAKPAAPSREARFDRRRIGRRRSGDGAVDQSVLSVRMDGRVSLPARPQRSAVDLGHRRLFVPGYCAWRRGADCRHVGDERLPSRPYGQDDWPQRPHVPARRRDAADRLRCGH